jgi:hypothetical protein
MNELAKELQQTVEMAVERLLTVPEPQTQIPKQVGQWTAKEILGHLIDSATNNHQRFIRAQFTDDLIFAGYDQEQWVRVQSYDQVSWQTLVQFWQAYNLHLAHVIAHIPETTLLKLRERHTLDIIGWQRVSANEPTTLAYLISDYIGHLQDHLRQIDDSVA